MSALPLSATAWHSALRGILALARAHGGARAVPATVAVCLVARVAGAAWLPENEHGLPVLVFFGAFEVCIWVLASAGGVAVGWSLPVRTRPTWRHALAVAAFALAATLLRAVVQFHLYGALCIRVAPFDVFLAKLFNASFLTTCTFAGLGVGLRSLVRERDLAATAARMEAELARARLRAVHGRIHPERLLATLAAISGAAEADPRAADRLLVSLGELLRLSLHRTQAEEVTLADELAYVAADRAVESGRAGRPAAPLRTQVPAALLPARVPPGRVSDFVQAALSTEDSGIVAATVVDGRLHLRVAIESPDPNHRNAGSTRISGDADSPDPKHPTDQPTATSGDHEPPDADDPADPPSMASGKHGSPDDDHRPDRTSVASGDDEWPDAANPTDRAIVASAAESLDSRYPPNPMTVRSGDAGGRVLDLPLRLGETAA